MIRERDKVLIIKPGYSETLDPENTGIVSLGDIVRTTVILHLFPKEMYHVTWLVDSAGLPMLRDNPMIDTVLKLNAFTPFHLMREQFDIVINLEKDPGICAMADTIPAWRRFGFRFDSGQGVVASYEHAHEAMAMVENPHLKRAQDKSWSSLLYSMLNARYEGQPMVLGYKPDLEKEYDVGLNYRAGAKFPLKIWPKSHWEALADDLSGDMNVCWQPPSDDVEHIETYFDWIMKCRVLVTNDSLGMHIAMAYGIPVVAFFGPTQAQEVDEGPRVTKLLPGEPCLGCNGTRCQRGTPCMESISVSRAAEAVRHHLENL